MMFFPRYLLFDLSATQLMTNRDNMAAGRRSFPYFYFINDFVDVFFSYSGQMQCFYLTKLDPTFSSNVQFVTAVKITMKFVQPLLSY